ncbi:MAG TPA: DUF4139 domain-containing protein [Sedimentisphaerales bacterium]|nr:DUF4139 domain-containing protein [Sedimentisphaerales bacterium]
MKTTAITLVMMLTAAAAAKIDLVTLPQRDTVQLTIYNSADLTLVRESRGLTLKEGENSLQFSWENTLIDPTSLSMMPLASADCIRITELTFPARVRNVGVWTVSSEVGGSVPMEITYLTSGLSWRAFYMGTMTQDETAMRLEGYVVVTNNSGEDYENAQTRLIVGQVHILDEIAELARRQYPFGRPGEDIYPQVGERMEDAKMRMLTIDRAAMAPTAIEERRKEIVKEGLSEYFLYTIEGTETIPTGWSKRLSSFDVADVPVMNLYKFEQERYGNQVVRFLSFRNDEKHRLGETPIPGGVLKVYRDTGDRGRLSYEGQSEFRYIPVGEEVELNLGPVTDVVVEPKLMSFASENHRFDTDGNIKGWDEVQSWKVEVKNTREVAVKVEIRRNFDTNYWKLDNSGDFGTYEKYDGMTAQYTLDIAPRSSKEFTYTLRTYHGTRQEESVD